MEGGQWCCSLDAIPTLRSGQSSSKTAVAEYADADAEYADAGDAGAEWSLAAIPSHR